MLKAALTETRHSIKFHVTLNLCVFCESLLTVSRHRIELHALGKISPGEEVNVSYVDYLNLSEDRRRLLKQHYFFDCTCEHCTNKTKDDLKMAGAEVEGVPVHSHALNIITSTHFSLS